jgi:NNP family nitrate/nitrite transporter-like MFS transporter
MAAGTAGAVLAVDAGSLGWFLAAMLALFTLAGIGNGATYRMIPAIFMRQAAAEMAAVPDGDATATGAGARAEARAGIGVRAKREAAATIGMAGSIGALGGFALPRVIGDSIRSTGGIGAAFTVFIVSYLVFCAVTWLCYLRPGAAMRGV